MTQPDDEFISFEKALRELDMQSNELKKLVSEGEIRAFKDGASMKFRPEDIDSLRGGSEELVFAETLEDDTGMVTAELSEEDTLLADDDLMDEDEEEAPAARPVVAVATRARAKAVVDEGPHQEPAWVTLTAVLSAVVLLWGFMITYRIAMDSPSGGFPWIFGQ